MLFMSLYRPIYHNPRGWIEVILNDLNRVSTLIVSLFCGLSHKLVQKLGSVQICSLVPWFFLCPHIPRKCLLPFVPTHFVVSFLCFPSAYTPSLLNHFTVFGCFLRRHATSSNGEDKVHVGYVIARGAMTTCGRWSYRWTCFILSTNWKAKSRNIPLSRRWLGIVLTRSLKHLNPRHVLLTLDFRSKCKLKRY
jgi:hypothetical protein